MEKGLTGKQIFVKVTSSVETGTLTSEKTAAVVEKEAQTTHLIINQVYGGGGKGKTPVSASFIELLQSNRRGYRTERLYHRIPQRKHTETAGADRNGHISHFLSDQRSGREDFCRSDLYDRESRSGMDLAISNKQYRILLKKGEEQIDGVSVNEEAAEGTALADPEK